MEHLSLGWGRMAYSDSGGAGPCVVFLHGTGCDATHWSQVLGELEGGTRAICPEFRGHGGSDAPPGPFTLQDLAEDILALIGRLDLPRPILAGHSLGGMAAIEAARRDGRVAALVLMEGWTRLRASAALGTGRLYGTLPPEKVAWIEERWKVMLRRFTPENWTHFWKSVSAFDGYAFLESARIPVYEVFGEQGRVPGVERRLLVPENPNIRWRWIPNGAHYLPLEHPGAVAQVCREAVRAEREKAQAAAGGRNEERI